MQVDFVIRGSITCPEGTRFSEEMANLLILPDGSSISVNPVLEHNVDPDSDNHRDLTFKEGEDLGVTYEMFARELTEVEEVPDDDLDFVDAEKVLSAIKGG